MLLKAGVDISRLNRPIRRTLPKVQGVFDKYRQLFIVTSTFEGDHSPGSLHYSNDAYDCDKPEIRAREIYLDIKKVLRYDYDVVLEKDHYHIEFDPKKGGNK